MAVNSVFISYRRDDTAGEAGRLAEHLERRLGADRVFFDIDAIPPGTDFVEELGEALDESSVMIVMIGHRWLSAANADGSRRLDDPKDFVYREIASALERDARVIPVLVQNVPMPTADVLPPGLVSLSRRQAMSIQHEEFGDDATRIADTVARLLGVGPAIAATAAIESVATSAPAPNKRGPILAMAVAAVLALGFFAVRWQQSSANAKAAAVASAIADSARSVRQHTVDELLTVATEQSKREQYAEAMNTLDSAVRIDASVQRVKEAREDLSMQWIRNLKVGEGSTFTAAMVRPLAVLDLATPSARGSRQSDMLAHIGWATFLRWRDNRSGPDPTDAYQRALAVDSTNPFANVMLGHWILSWEKKPAALDRARSYFRIAVDANRELAAVRRIQLAALFNDVGVGSELEAIRVLNDMRARSEPLPPSARSAWRTYYYALNGQVTITVSDLMTLLPAAEHLSTFQWAFTEYAQRDEGSHRIFRFYVARMHAQAGDTASATDSLRAIRRELGGDSGSLRDAVDAALTQLGATKGSRK